MCDSHTKPMSSTRKERISRERERTIPPSSHYVPSTSTITVYGYHQIIGHNSISQDSFVLRFVRSAAMTPKMLATSSTNEMSSTSSALVPRLISGSIGSVVTALAVTPLEVVKIRQQISTTGAASQFPSKNSPSLLFRGVKVGPSTTCPGCGTIILNNGLMDCVLPIESTTLPLRSSTLLAPKSGRGTIATLVSIFQNEGISGLYAGLRPTLAMSVPNTVLYFTTYDEISIRLRHYHSKNFSETAHGGGRTTTVTEKQIISLDEGLEDAKRQAYIPLVAGSTARLLATMATAPLELIRTRQASVVTTRRDRSTRSAVMPGLLDEFKTLTRTRGFSSLYAGLAPTLWRDVPFSAFYWLFLERFRNVLSDSSSEELLGPWGGAYYRDMGVKLPPSIEAMHAFIAGAAAGSMAAALTTPFDVVKTRQQIVGGQNIVDSRIELHCGRQACVESSKERPLTTKVLGTWGHMHQILQAEGISGLWKGNVTRMVKIAPACAIMISCYEFGKNVFEV